MTPDADLSRDDLIIRGSRARQLLEDPVLMAAFADVEADAIEGIASTKVFDGDGLAQHAAMLQAVRAVRDVLKGYVTGGDSASRPSRHRV